MHTNLADSVRGSQAKLICLIHVFVLLLAKNHVVKTLLVIFNPNFFKMYIADLFKSLRNFWWKENLTAIMCFCAKKVAYKIQHSS